MKVLLIQPPIQDFYQTAIRTQPIGLAYLAASLQAHGHEVMLLDCQSTKKTTLPIPSEFSYLKEFYPFNDQSPFKLYSGYYHWGMGWAEIKRAIEDANAEVYGISSSFTPYHGEALRVARIIKEWDSTKRVVMGGAHVSCAPEEVLKNPFVDYIILGEGEIRFPLLLAQIERDKCGVIKDSEGIGYRVDGKVRVHPLRYFIKELDSLPHPARSLLDLNRYRIKKKRSTMIITSRGCPQGCVYCSTHLVMGSAFRTRSPEHILQEMVECHTRHGIQVFDIEDDNFSLDQARAKHLLNCVIETFGTHTLEMTAMNGLSYASLDKELLQLMKQAGFHTINISVVSTDAVLTHTLGRPGGYGDFASVLRMAGRVGLNVIAYAILGIPGQTIDEMAETIGDLMGERVLIGPSIYYPTPGTALFDRCRKEGILPSLSSQWRSSAFPVETTHFTRLDIVTLFRLVRVINFIKGKMNEHVVDEGITWEVLARLLEERRKVIPENELILSEEKMNDRLVDPSIPTWAEVLRLLLKERVFYSLRKNAAGGIVLAREASSRKVIDYFFDHAWKKPLMKSQNN